MPIVYLHVHNLLYSYDLFSIPCYKVSVFVSDEGVYMMAPTGCQGNQGGGDIQSAKYSQGGLGKTHDHCHCPVLRQGYRILHIFMYFTTWLIFHSSILPL